MLQVLTISKAAPARSLVSSHYLSGNHTRGACTAFDTEYLQREEQVERRNRQADESWEEYRTTGAHLSHEAMEAWLDTWGTDREGSCPDLER